MISAIKQGYALSSGNSTLLLYINEIAKVTLAYYGPRLSEPIDLVNYLTPYPMTPGNATVYDEKKAPFLSLDALNLELTTPYKGDYGSPSLVIEGSASPVYDFSFVKGEIRKPEPLDGLPSPHVRGFHRGRNFEQRRYLRFVFVFLEQFKSRCSRRLERQLRT